MPTNLVTSPGNSNLRSWAIIGLTKRTLNTISYLRGGVSAAMATSSTIKLTYLDYRGRAELLRFILAQASVNFEDNRIKPQDWAGAVPGTEFGIPVLEIEGKILKTNGVIAGFLAHKYDIAGSNAEEMKETQDILDITEESWNKMSKFFWEKDEAKKVQIMTELSSHYLPATLKKLQDMVVKNSSGSGWIVGQNVTYADLAITILLDALSQYKPEILLAFTTLAQLKKNVEELPNIAKWIAKRPDTQH